MSEFLTTSGIAHYLEQVIKKADKELYIMSPYLNLSPIFLQRLIDADKKGKTINIIYRNDKLKDNERRKLEKLKNLNLYHHQTLHAKGYANEGFIVITSMNMIEYSEKNNREMGVVFFEEKDGELYSEAMDELQSIIDNAKVLMLQREKKPETNIKEKSAELNSTEKEIKNLASFAMKIPVSDFSLTTPFKTLGLSRGLDAEYYWDSEDEWEQAGIVEEFFDSLKDKFRFEIDYDCIVKSNNLKDLSTEIERQRKAIVASFKNKQIGYCIRDGVMIPFDTKNPFCERAFRSWNRYKNPNYKENYCHKTGKPSNGKTNFNNPIL